MVALFTEQHKLMEFHEVANIFPLIEGKEFDDLVEDIRTNGLQQPIWIYQGKIIDGRNRYRACKAADVDPRYQEWDGKGSLVAFTISLNVKRRHLTSSQLGVIALETERLFAEEARSNMSIGGGDKKSEPVKSGLPNLVNPIIPIHAAEETAKSLGVSKGYVIDAKRIARDAPELIEHIKEGTLTIPDAKEIAPLSEAQRSRIIEKVVQRKEEEGKRVSRSVRDAIWEEVSVDNPIKSTELMILKERQDQHVLDVMGSSESPEWYTPKAVIDCVLACFGEIDLDPCSNSHDCPTVPARVLYTRDDDGLSQDWHGKVYLNPPYGSEIPVWTGKLVDEYKRGHITEAIALLPGRIDTNWFQPLYEYVMCNVHGRLQFANSPYNSPFPAVIVYLGTRIGCFIDAFKALGPIMRRIG